MLDLWQRQYPELIYINILSLYGSRHIFPYNRRNLGVKFGWGFLSEPRPLKPPCLVERG